MQVLGVYAAGVDFIEFASVTGINRTGRMARGIAMENQPQAPTDTKNSDHEGDQTDVRLSLWEAIYFGADDEEAAAATPHMSENPMVSEVAIADAEKAALGRRVGNGTAAAEAQADELGDSIYSKFMHLLTEKMRATDGHLTDQDVEEMGAEFRTELAGIKTAFLEAVETYTIAREKNRVDQARGHLFQRLLVKNFESAFRDEKTLQENPGFLSRRMLPGFFTMLSLMFGAEKLADYEQQTKKVINRLRQTHDGQLDWDTVYNSPEARKISLLAEVEIAQYFRSFDKRIEWMQAMVNSNLIPLRENRFGSSWIFNRQAATTLLAGLFNDLQDALANQTARAAFVKRLGSELVADLETVVKRVA